MVFTLLLIEELSTLDFGLDLLGRMVNILKVEASLFVLVQYGALLNPEEKKRVASSWTGPEMYDAEYVRVKRGILVQTLHI